MPQKKERRKSRKTSLCVLYSNDIVGVKVEDVLSGKVILPHLDEIDEYAAGLIRGTAEHKEEIDAKLLEVSENWALERMPSTDRCLLRQSVYEMMYVDEVPISVSINEAVELAKEFGGEDDSHKFVNGILGKIAKEIDEG